MTEWRFVLSFAWCYFVLVFFSPSNIGETRANLSAFRTVVRFALIWFGLRLVIVVLPGLFFFFIKYGEKIPTLNNKWFRELEGIGREHCLFRVIFYTVD